MIKGTMGIFAALVVLFFYGGLMFHQGMSYRAESCLDAVLQFAVNEGVHLPESGWQQFVRLCNGEVPPSAR